MAQHSHHTLRYHTPRDRIHSLWMATLLTLAVSLEVDGARPRATAVILAGRISAQTTWLTAALKQKTKQNKKRWTKHRHTDLCCHGGEGGLTGTIVSVCDERKDPSWWMAGRNVQHQMRLYGDVLNFSLVLTTRLTFLHETLQRVTCPLRMLRNVSVK